MGARSFGRRVGGASSTVMGVPLRWETPVAGEAARVAGVGGQGVHRKPLSLPLHFAANLELLRKQKKKKKVLGKKKPAVAETQFDSTDS